MATIEERVAALEAQVTALTAVAGAAPAPAGVEGDGADPFWVLQGLKRQLPPDGPGAVLYAGVVPAGAGERYEWQWGVRTDQLLTEEEPAETVAALAALAHPVRLVLVREILAGRRTAAELAELDGLGTTGQLYHHLRQLVAAGWLRSTGRGSYAVPGERVVPLLVIIAAARR